MNVSSIYIFAQSPWPYGLGCLAFYTKGLGFNPWTGHRDCTLVLGTLHLGVPLHQEKNRYFVQ